MVGLLAQEAVVRAVYLFGSHVEGTPDRWSDIDLAMFIDRAEEWDLERHVRVAVRVKKQLGDDLDPHFFPAEHLNDPPRASFSAYILKHGVRIEGF